MSTCASEREVDGDGVFGVDPVSWTPLRLVPDAGFANPDPGAELVDAAIVEGLVRCLLAMGRPWLLPMAPSLTTQGQVRKNWRRHVV